MRCSMTDHPETQTESIDTEPCAACDQPIDPEAQVCPECGNHPAKKAKWASVGIMVAGLFLMLVFPPVAALLFLVGLVARIGMIWTEYPAVEYSF